MKAFKAVNRYDDDQLWSAFLRRSGVVYEPGKEAKPREGWGPLAAFCKTDRAIAWVEHFFCEIQDYFPNETMELWECEAVPSKESIHWCFTIDGKIAKADPTEGSITCDSITLTRLLGIWNGKNWTGEMK